ncbi:MAG: alpha/beta fold hydrolase [Pseudomonadota bacterium]
MPAPVVLIPDRLCDARIFAPQIAALSATRAVHVAPITRGASIEEIAGAVLEDAPDRFALAGLAMGGTVALDVLRQRPDRVLRLALLDTSPLPETPQIAASREPQIVAARSDRLLDVVREELLPSYLAAGPRRGEVRKVALAMAEALGPEVFVRQTRALQRRPDPQSVLKSVKVPTLVLCGREDAVCPVRHHELMATLAPGATLEIIDGAGHLPTLEAPEATNAALERWLSGTLLLT